MTTVAHAAPSSNGGARRRPVATTPRSTIALIVLLGSFAVGWNLTKAYHVDDTAYLEIAQWIASHPAHPMRGDVFWGDVPEGIDRINQPHGYFYLMAAWGSVFGWSEVAMHSLQGLFAVAAIILMHRLARLVAPDNATLATVLVVASPGFVVGQNTFVDVPLLALWLLFFAILLNGVRRPRGETTSYFIAGLVCGVAILIKYTSLVLLPALLLDGLLRRRYSCWIGATTAATMVLAWCAFNYWDYGAVHMLSRHVSWQVLDGTKWLLCVGATAPAALVLAAARLACAPGRVAHALAAILVALVLIVAITVVAAAAGMLREAACDAALVVFFVAGGAALTMLAAMGVRPPTRVTSDEDVRRWLLVYWAIGCATFILLLAPFVAVRHALLALPPLVLLALASPKAIRGRWALAACVITGAVTSCVAAADRWYAQIYRDAAVSLRRSLPVDATVWTLGHWGWQWYARQNGMTQFIQGRSVPREGDYIVYPAYASRQPDPGGIKTRVIRELPVAPGRWWQYFAVPDAGFYQTTSFDRLPWAVRHAPIEVFRVVRVELE